MSEMIVKLNTDHVKIKGCEYVQDLVRCEKCRHFDPINNDDHGYCAGGLMGKVYGDEWCSRGEPWDE